MKVTRTLHPIGQGAFYTEKFEYEGGQCNVVFDCGGTSSVIKGRVEDYCNSLPCNGKDKKPTIDAVFISHFDNDHVNGLETLLNKAEVKCIFLPLLNDDEVYALSLSFVEKLGDPLSLYSKLVESAISGEDLEWDLNEGKKIKIVRIRKVGDTEGNGDEEYDLDSDDSRTEIPSGTSIKPKNSTPWIFKTFNFGNAEGKREKQLKKALKKRGYELSLTELIKKWQAPQYQDGIRKCYKFVSGSMNANSMVTYSGPKDRDIEVSHRFTCLSRPCDWRNLCCCKFLDGKLAGSMYFGDYEAKGGLKWKQYEDSFKSLIPLLHVQQVPHHGSRHNYNVKLNKPKKKMNFISAGKASSFPHSETLYELNKSKAPWIWIHEDSKRVVFEYDVSES